MGDALLGKWCGSGVLLYDAFYHLHSVRGQSVFFFNLALIERNMQVKFDLKLSVYTH